MRVALYVRVSTADQSLALQLTELREYCQRRGLKIVEEYEDRMSGAKDRRPALDRLMTDASRRKFDAVVVWRFDRFARSVSHLLRALEQFNALGVQFISLTEAVDTSTPMGKMVFTVLGAVAELERNLIRERVVAGMKVARKNGKHCGRPRCMVDAARVRKMRKDGATWEKIAAALGAPRSVCQRAVRLHPVTGR
jgi:DNA invertase Pin-like site-specific DNA recombinase